MAGMVTQVEGADGPGTTRLTVSGQATVAAAAELRKELLAALESADQVVLEVGGLTDCDATFFQLLCAGCRHAQARGGRLLPGPAAADRLRGLAEENGFHPADDCYKQGGCLLAKEEEI